MMQRSNQLWRSRQLRRTNQFKQFLRPVLRLWFQLSVACLLVVASLGAGFGAGSGAGDTPEARFNATGHKMMCTCSCAQVLLECNHVGCPVSGGMRSELQGGIERGDSESDIFNAFVQKYGPTVLAAPMRGGFDNVAWVVPFAVLLLATLGTALLIRKWQLRTVPTPALRHTREADALRERIRRDTEF